VAFSSARIVDTVALRPRFRRLRLHVEDPAALDVPAVPDAAVGIFFPGPDGAPDTSEGRNYSVRRQDGPVLTVDVILHAHGPGTSWAAAAQVGDRVGVDHARSWYLPPAGTRELVLVADLSGLPAAARIVEELPADAAATLIVEVADPGDLGYLSPHPGVTVTALSGTGNGRAASGLAAAVEALALPSERGYCWFAGEAAQCRRVRKHLRGLGWPVDRYDAIGYWRQDSQAWDARFAAIGDRVLSVYEQALADGKGDKVAFEEFDDACERIGL
jgi:NADPH-dependent ferric siderophore reductase